jgi:aspartate/methionine/tyrosine aminotransferase
MVLPEAMVRPVERIAQNLFISPSELSQWAALGAFAATEELEAVKAGYATSRALLLERLPAIGLDRFLPVDGAFYLYADVSRFTNDSLDFSRRMLTEAGIAATPGLDFDTARGAQYLRFSFAGRTEAVREACDRLAGWL